MALLLQGQRGGCETLVAAFPSAEVALTILQTLGADATLLFAGGERNMLTASFAIHETAVHVNCLIGDGGQCC